jgi:hypothetical protein
MLTPLQTKVIKLISEGYKLRDISEMIDHPYISVISAKNTAIKKLRNLENLRNEIAEYELLCQNNHIQFWLSYVTRTREKKVTKEE